MTSKSVLIKMIQCFVWAGRVNHYYWLYTDADDTDGSVSVENLQIIIGRKAGLHITKRLVDFEGTTLRGNIERYEDHAIINVRASQSENWQRFTVVKELCHVLLDTADDWSTDVVETIAGLLAFSRLTGDESPAIRSEKLAEVMALELIYPLEERREDRAFIQAGGKVSDLADKRKVPPLWIERGISDWYYEACEETWKVIGDSVNDNTPLPDPVPEPAHPVEK
jgi:Zn-dependent peptidase ImmA (M78 family)